MYTETSTNEIHMIATSWFLRMKKKKKLEIYQESVTEMTIPCTLPQSKKKSFLKKLQDGTIISHYIA